MTNRTPIPASPGGATVYLLRHGQTKLNAAGALRGLSDVELDEIGKQEAQRLARLFELVGLAQVVSSPLRRARDTAAAVAQEAGAHFMVDPRFVDRDYGRWTGRSAEELDRSFGDVNNAPGVEPASAVTARVVDGLREVAARADGRLVAVVAHDAVNRLLLAHLVPGLDGAELAQPTGCWNRLVLTSHGWEAPVIGAVPGDGASP